MPAPHRPRTALAWPHTGERLAGSLGLARDQAALRRHHLLRLLLPDQACRADAHILHLEIDHGEQQDADDAHAPDLELWSVLPELVVASSPARPRARQAALPGEVVPPGRVPLRGPRHGAGAGVRAEAGSQ